MFLSESCRKDGWVEVPLGSVDQESLEKLDEMGLKPDIHFYWGSGVSWLKRDLIQATAKEEPKFWDGEVDQPVEGDALARCPDHGKMERKE